MAAKWLVHITKWLVNITMMICAQTIAAACELARLEVATYPASGKMYFLGK
jgi:hypothetical protein